MKLVVRWSPASKDEYAQILEYIESEFGLEAALKFLDKTDGAIEQISLFPSSGLPTTKNTVRKKVITKHTTLFYEIFEKTVAILHFWDNHQDPEQLKTLI